MSAIRLRGATSGTTDVVAAAIAGDGVMTLPTGTGTLATQAFVDAAVAAGGKVLQVLSTTKLDTFSASIATTAESGNVTGLTVAITPASTSSKILVSGFISLGNDTATYATLYRNDSLLTSGVGATDGSASRVTASTFGANSFELLSTPFSVLDSPASVAALTYSLRLRHGGGGTKTVFVNRPTDGTTSAVYPRTISSITVMEIGA